MDDILLEILKSNISVCHVIWKLTLHIRIWSHVSYKTIYIPYIINHFDAVYTGGGRGLNMRSDAQSYKLYEWWIHVSFRDLYLGFGYHAFRKELIMA